MLLNYWNNFDRPLLNCFYSKTSPTRTLQVIPVIQQRPLLLPTIRFGPGPVLALIEASPSVNRLYPLVTALRLELGIETKVAKEVEDVASDIRQDLARRRQQGPP